MHWYLSCKVTLGWDMSTKSYRGVQVVRIIEVRSCKILQTIFCGWQRLRLPITSKLWQPGIDVPEFNIKCTGGRCLEIHLENHPGAAANQDSGIFFPSFREGGRLEQRWEHHDWTAPYLIVIKCTINIVFLHGKGYLSLPILQLFLTLLKTPLTSSPPFWTMLKKHQDW